jgi:histidine triad (HIT) family protein
VSGVQSECLVCAELDGGVDVPGGLVIRANLVAAFHLPPLNAQTVYAGHVLVVPRRHSPGFAELTSREAAAIGVAVSDLSRCLQGMGAERVYTATIGHIVDHLHVHLLPRWPETPADVPWHAVGEWAGARKIDSDGIVALCAALRP